MNFYTLIFIASSFFCNKLFCQKIPLKSIIIGLEGGPKYSFSELHSNGCGTSFHCFQVLPDGRGSKPRPSHLYGLNLGFEFYNNVILETGLYNNSYRYTYYFQMVDLPNSEKYSIPYLKYDTWEIPFRLKMRINMARNRLFIIPSLGTSSIRFWRGKGDYELNNFEGIVSTNYVNSFSLNPYNDTIFYSNYILHKKRSTPLLESRLDLEYQIKKNVFLNFTVSLHTGFRELSRVDISYKSNDPNFGGRLRGAISNKGTCLSFLFGLKYSISSLFVQNVNSKPY